MELIHDQTIQQEGFEIVARHLVMERDLNQFGNAFGGIVLSWIDEGSYLYIVEKTGYGNFVTVSMDGVNFRAPTHKGDCASLFCRIEKIGNSSIVVRSRAFTLDVASGKRREIISCNISFVALKDKKPYPYFQTEEFKLRGISGLLSGEEKKVGNS